MGGQRARPCNTARPTARPRRAGSNSDGLAEIENEDLAVADLAGVGGALDGLDGGFEAVVGDCYLDLYLRHEGHGVFGTAVDLGLTLLAAEPLYLGDRETLDPQ